MAPAPRLVVRTHAPLRRMLLIGGIAVLACMALFIAFEWGHSNAGFDGRTARLRSSELRERIDELEAENKRLSVELARQDNDRVGQVRERTELAQNIGELQAEVARLTSDLAFYRGIAGDNSRDAVLKIQQFRITRGAGKDQYLMRMVLGRPIGREDAINGQIRIAIEGASTSTPITLDLGSVSQVEGGQLSFNYRYSQTLEVPLQLPEGFFPRRTSVEIIPARKGVNPVRASFLWAVEN